MAGINIKQFGQSGAGNGQIMQFNLSSGLWEPVTSSAPVFSVAVDVDPDHHWRADEASNIIDTGRFEQLTDIGSLANQDLIQLTAANQPDEIGAAGGVPLHALFNGTSDELTAGTGFPELHNGEGCTLALCIAPIGTSNQGILGNNASDSNNIGFQFINNSGASGALQVKTAGTAANPTNLTAGGTPIFVASERHVFIWRWRKNPFTFGTALETDLWIDGYLAGHGITLATPSGATTSTFGLQLGATGNSVNNGNFQFCAGLTKAEVLPNDLVLKLSREWKSNFATEGT